MRIKKIAIIAATAFIAIQSGSIINERASVPSQPETIITETAAQDSGKVFLAVENQIPVQENNDSKNILDESFQSESSERSQNRAQTYNQSGSGITEKEIQHDRITIPGVCYEAVITEGSTQWAVDAYDICLMTEAASTFGQGRAILLGGHRTKSLKYLYRTSCEEVISVQYNNQTYRYKVVYSGECTNDGQKLYDIRTGVNMLDYSVDQETLYIYTCFNNNNWLVKAILI